MAALHRIVFIGLSLALVAGLSACGGSTGIPVDSEPQFNVPWPPSEQGVHQVSDDVFSLTGWDYTSKHPDVLDLAFPPESLKMLREDPADPFLWATYSLGGFNASIAFDSVAIDFMVQSAGPDNPVSLYIGLANYDLGYWEWTETTTSPFVFNPDELDTAKYLSPGNAVHIALAMVGVGDAWIYGLDFSRTGDTTLPIPQNLQATAERDLITLTWDPIVTSDGYHVYRDTHKSFPAPEKLTDGAPLTDPTFEDTPPSLERGIMYFYRVTNEESALESIPSDYVDIYSPESTREMPYNLGGYSTGPDTYVAQWSWNGTFPNYFRIYYSEEPDFNLTTDTPTLVEIPGYKTDAEFDLKGTGDTIYWRIAAYQGSHGKMTDDIIGETIEIWEWTPLETIGDGSYPFHAIKVDGDISVAYTNAGKVDFARRDGGSWTAETAINSSVMGGFIGMSYSGTEYAIAAQATDAHDLWAGSGTPGSWTSARLHGDGGTGLGHPVSGVNIQMVSTPTTHYLVHYDPAASIMLHTKPSGSGSWSAPENLWAANIGNNPLSFATDSGNVFLLSFAPDDTVLYLADLNGGWTRDNVYGTDMNGFGEYINLVRYDGEWWSSGYNPTSGQRHLVMHHGTSVPWTEETVRDTGLVGEYAKIAVMDTMLACSYLRRDSDIWELGLYDGSTWDISPLVVPGVDTQQFQVMGFGDTPFIVFNDIDAGQMKAAIGTPPAP